MRSLTIKSFIMVKKGMCSEVAGDDSGKAGVATFGPGTAEPLKGSVWCLTSYLILQVTWRLLAHFYR